jgi:cellobiose phosphorylase
MATRQSTAKIFPGLPEYFNSEARGLYCYLTGSASWLMFLLVTQVCGVRGERGDLVLDPQLLAEDFGGSPFVSVQTQLGDRRVLVTFERTKTFRGAQSRVLAVADARGKPVRLEPHRPAGVMVRRRDIPAAGLVVRLG